MACQIKYQVYDIRKRKNKYEYIKLNATEKVHICFCTMFVLYHYNSSNQISHEEEEEEEEEKKNERVI